MCRCGLHRKQARRDVFFPPPGSLREAHCAGARWVPWVPDRKNCKINPDSASGVILPLHSRVQGTASLSSPLGALTSCQGEGWSDIFPSSSTTANKIALPSRVALFNGLRPGSAAPTHLRIAARDERKHAICRQTQTDTKTRRQTRSGGGGSSRTRRQTQMRRQTQTEPDRHKYTDRHAGGGGGKRRKTQIRRQTQTDTDRHRQTQRDRDRHARGLRGHEDRRRQTQTDTKRHRQTRRGRGVFADTKTDADT